MSDRAAAAHEEPRGLIELRDVTIRFRYESVLRNINLAVKAGETICIIGESGCGKTVMLKLIIGLLHPTKGTVHFDGADVAGLDGKQLVKMRLRFGFLFQMAALFDSLTVFDNVAFGLREHRVCDEARCARLSPSGCRRSACPRRSRPESPPSFPEASASALGWRGPWRSVRK